MIFFRFLVLFSVMLTTVFITTANASQQPRFLGTEKKFRSFVYNPNDVYRYLGHYTYQGFIEFASDESVQTISMGDPSLWLFEHLGNRLFLKPVGEYNSETNMTVITNKRIYHFELTAKEASGIDDKDLIFVAKFSYPDDKDKNIVQFPKAPKSDEPDMRNLSLYNFSYQYTGEPAIAPAKVFDNGEFTYFQFAKKSAEIPAIFTVDSSGFESLVNFRSAGSYIIVERLSPQFTLRSGPDIVCVYNSNMYSNGKLNSKFSAINQSGAPTSSGAFNPNIGSGFGASASPDVLQGLSQDTQLAPQEGPQSFGGYRGPIAQ
jgi:type IV secretion system protein VirB9